MHFILNCLFFIISAIAVTIHAAHLPKTFKTCKNSDANYQVCIKDAIESSLIDMIDGIPSLGVPKIEPLLIEKVHIGGNGGKVDIDQVYTDLYVHGFSASKMENVKISLDGDDCQLKVRTLTPTVRLVGQYKIVGKVLILQINGFGATNITLTNLISEHEINCEKVADKNGKQVLKLGAYNLEIKTEKIQFDFENLVQGNPELSAEVSKVINDNSLEVFEEIRKDYGNTFAEILKQVAIHILTKVPYDEYYLP